MSRVALACRRFLATLGAAAALGATAPPPPTPDPWPLAAAIDRYDPRLYDAGLEVALVPTLAMPYGTDPVLASATFVLPMALAHPTCDVDRASIRTAITVRGRRDAGADAHRQLLEDRPLGQAWICVPSRGFPIDSLRWSVEWRARAWSCRIDEAMLARSTWPREWPEEVRDALKPQLGIESEDPLFAGFVRDKLGDRLRTLSPYAAAKELLRSVCTAFRAVNAEGIARGAGGAFVGFDMKGAKRAALDGAGSSHDLVAACVAVLRAAGIPARPVIGIAKEESRPGRESVLLVSWGEFLVPGAGWVPFDPVGLRSEALRTVPLTRPWNGLGNLPDLNRRVAVSYSFAPEQANLPSAPAGWGWQPIGNDPSMPLDGYIAPRLVSRGRAPR